MAVSTEDVSTESHRPVTVKAAVGALVLVGLTPLWGGIEMPMFPRGNRFVKGEWLAERPHIPSWPLPGLAPALDLGARHSVVDR